MNESRRFDEKEFAVILRHAAELQARDSAHAPRSGMTLREIETIAAEAGIDAKYLRAAAQNLTTHAPTTWQRLAGPPTHVTAQRSVAGEYDAEALAALVDAAQAEFGLPGTTRQALGGVEWEGKGPFGPVQVTARPLGGETRVRVSTDRQEAAGVIYTLLPITGLIGGGIAAALLAPGAEVIAAGAGLAAGVGTARLLWQNVVSRWQRRVESVLDRVTRAAGSSRTEERIP